MRRIVVVGWGLLLSGCALHAARTQTELPPAPVQAQSVAASNHAPEQGAAPAQPEAVAATAQDAGVAPELEAPDDSTADDGDSEDGPAAVEEEGESHEAAPGAEALGNRYSSELSDEELTSLWKASPEKLGSISIGFADEGRMVNSVQFPCGEGWTVVSPERAYGTQETIDDVLRAIKKVLAQYPDSPPLRVNQISAKDGGYLRPHKSHQSGRDVDLAFYYPTAQPIRARERERYIDVKRTWALLRAVVTETDVQKVLLDRHVQKVLYDYALKSGEDKGWLDSIFHAGKDSIVVHARRHRDHMHVRFFNGRAQELGRRVAPLLALRPEQNLVFHRVHSGDILGAIARRYGTTVEALRRANHIKGSMLHLSQVLRVPLRGPCTRCPIPPEVVVPARHLPPQLAATQPPMVATTSAPAASIGVASASGAPGSASPEPAVMKVSTGVAPPVAVVPIENLAAVSTNPSPTAPGINAGVAAPGSSVQSASATDPGKAGTVTAPSAGTAPAESPVVAPSSAPAISAASVAPTVNATGPATKVGSAASNPMNPGASVQPNVVPAALPGPISKNLPVVVPAANVAAQPSTSVAPAAASATKGPGLVPVAEPLKPSGSASPSPVGATSLTRSPPP